MPQVGLSWDSPSIVVGLLRGLSRLPSLIEDHKISDAHSWSILKVVPFTFWSADDRINTYLIFNQISFFTILFHCMFWKKMIKIKNTYKVNFPNLFPIFFLYFFTIAGFGTKCQKIKNTYEINFFNLFPIFFLYFFTIAGFD